MLKKGFTLQELLITLGIIGVVAALTIPAVVKMMPDQAKVKYMKVYEALTNVTQEIWDDPVLYRPSYDIAGGTGRPRCEGIGCISIQPADNPFQPGRPLSVAAIYPAAVALKLNIDKVVTAKGGSYEFLTSDGVLWSFRTTIAHGEDNISLHTVVLTVDVDGEDKGANQTYDEGAKNPDRFVFRIDNDGGITAIDRLGRAFLENSTDMHSHREDRAAAEKLEKMSTK